MNRLLPIALVAATFVLAVACDASPPPPEPTPTPTPTATPTPHPCLESPVAEYSTLWSTHQAVADMASDSIEALLKELAENHYLRDYPDWRSEFVEQLDGLEAVPSGLKRIAATHLLGDYSVAARVQENLHIQANRIERNLLRAVPLYREALWAQESHVDFDKIEEANELVADVVVAFGSGERKQYSLCWPNVTP